MGRGGGGGKSVEVGGQRAKGKVVRVVCGGVRAVRCSAVCGGVLWWCVCVRKR